MSEQFEHQAKEYISKLEGFDRLNEEQRLALVDLMKEVIKFQSKSSQVTLAQGFVYAQTGSSGWGEGLNRGWNSITEFIEFFVVFGKLIFAKQKLGDTNTAILERVIRENPETFLTIGKYILENYLGTILTKNIDSSDSRKTKINDEIQKFVEANKGDIEKLILSNEISEIIKELEIMLVFTGKIPPENTSLAQRYKQDPPSRVTFNDFFASIHRTYNRPTINPILTKFFSAYRGGQFPHLQELTEGKVSQNVSPEYQLFASDVGFQKAIIDIFGNPQLGPRLTQVGNALEEIMRLEGVGGRLSRGGMSAAEKRRLIEVQVTIIADALLEVIQGVIGQLKRFLKENPQVWQYFLDNGFVLQNKGTGEINVMIKVLGGGVGVGSRKVNGTEVSSDALIDAFFSNDILVPFFMNYFIDMFRVGGIWRGFKKWEHNTDIQGILRQNGIRTAHRLPLSIATRSAPEHKEITGLFAALLSATNSGQGTDNVFQSRVAPIQSYFETRRRQTREIRR